MVHGKKRQGIPCGNHRARQATKKEYDELLYFLGMDCLEYEKYDKIFGSNRTIKYINCSILHRKCLVTPWYTGNFNTTYNNIAKVCHGFLMAYKGR